MDKVVFEEDDINFEAVQKMLEPLSTPAARGDAAPSGLSVLERGYYERLRDIYKSYNSGSKTIEQAKKDKVSLQRDYFEEYKGNIEGIAVALSRQEDIKKSDEARSKALKSENIAEIALIACETVSILTGDKPFGKLAKEKIENLLLKNQNAKT